MPENQDQRTPALAFSQRYGYAPLPAPMTLGEISPDLRRQIWNAVSRWSDDVRFFNEFAIEVLGDYAKKCEDEIPHDGAYKMIKTAIIEHDFNKVLDLIEIMINYHRGTKEQARLGQRIKELFEENAAAYRLDVSQSPFQFFPCASQEEGDAVEQAVETLHTVGMSPAAQHLREAATHIRDQRYGDSIAHSIRAVESVARRIAPKNSANLKQALSSLREAGVLKHKALEEALNKLYGYASDEQGIRHALLDKDAPDVGLDEAVFMFGACASFAAYLTNKRRQVDHGQKKAPAGNA